MIVVGAVVALVAAGGVGFALGRSTAGASPSDAARALDARDSQLPSAFAACQGQDKAGTVVLEDDGAMIVVDTGSQNGDAAGLNCVLSMLGTPGSIQAQIGRTTATMAAQEAEHEGVRYSWSYSPDNGVDLVITDASTSG